MSSLFSSLESYSYFQSKEYFIGFMLVRIGELDNWKEI